MQLPEKSREKFNHFRDSVSPSAEKVNPFKESATQNTEKSNSFVKELPMPRQPQLNKDKPESKSRGREITITIKPWKLVKGFFVLVLLLGLFFAGRFSAGEDSFLPDFSKYFSQDAGPSGLVTGDANEAEKTEASSAEVEAAASEEQNKTEESSSPAESSENVSEAVEDVPKAPEKIISEGYSKVTLSLDGVYKDWKGTWGKIKGVKYTITNNEAGTIKPHHFAMVVEGYEDGEKHFDVSYTSQRIKSGQVLVDEAAVSGGFAYSAVSIPDSDLTKVRISLILLDEDSETIAAVNQEVDLSGN
ncbi:hypothetical protein HY494_00215 [Candidatus Woesearchaeota archaeon]|nr:hypothetical protein [Candidatus Woesearchaeota archaeon]